MGIGAVRFETSCDERRQARLVYTRYGINSMAEKLHEMLNYMHNCVIDCTMLGMIDLTHIP